MRSKHSTKIAAAKLSAEQLGEKHGAAVKRTAQAAKATATVAVVTVTGYIGAAFGKMFS